MIHVRLLGYFAMLALRGCSASGRNSGVMCTGYDAPHDSLEFELLRAGADSLLRYVKSRGLPHRACGSLVVAFTHEELALLPAIVKENHDIGAWSFHFCLFACTHVYLRAGRRH